MDAKISGVKVPDDLREEFDDLLIDSNTLLAKHANFSHVIHEEQKALVIRSKLLWTEALEIMGLQGEWRYKDGILYPVDETATK